MPGDLFRVRARLPVLALPAKRGTVALRSFDRNALLLVVPHGPPECTACTDWLRTLAPLTAEFALWDGAVLCVARSAAALQQIAASVPELRGAFDPDARITGTVAVGEACVLLADRYGEVFAAWRTGDGAHALPDAAEVRDWFRFLTTQCPECGVPDVPGGVGR